MVRSFAFLCLSEVLRIVTLVASEWDSSMKLRWARGLWIEPDVDGKETIQSLRWNNALKLVISGVDSNYITRIHWMLYRLVLGARQPCSKTKVKRYFKVDLSPEQHFLGWMHC